MAINTELSKNKALNQAGAVNTNITDVKAPSFKLEQPISQPTPQAVTNKDIAVPTQQPVQQPTQPMQQPTPTPQPQPRQQQIPQPRQQQTQQPVNQPTQPQASTVNDQ